MHWPLPARTRTAFVALLLACLATATLLAGCSGRTPSERVSTILGDWIDRLPFRESDAPLPVDLLVLAPAGDPLLRARMAETALTALQASPGISPTVTVEPLTARIFQQVMAGRLHPDVLILSAAQVDELVEAQQLAPLALSATLTDALDPRLLDAGTRAGRLYCAPHSFHTLALFYNKDLFDQAEIAYPDVAWRWADLRAAAAAVEELPTFRFMPFGLVLSPDISRWLPFLLQASSAPPLDDPGAVFTDPAALRTGLGYVTGLYTETLAATPGYFSAAWAGEVFGNGRAAMTIEGNWLVDYLAENYPERRYGVAPLPRGESAATLLFPFCVAVGAQTEHPALVQQVISALLATDIHAMSVPARTTLWPDWQAAHPAHTAFVTQVEDSALWSEAWSSAAQVAQYQEIVRALLAGDISVEEAVAAFGAEAQAQ